MSDSGNKTLPIPQSRSTDGLGVTHETPRVDALIAGVMAKYKGHGTLSQARYYEAVHQELAPLARDLELETMQKGTHVGWIVFGKDIRSAALYPLDQEDEAQDAFRRWGDCSIMRIYTSPNDPRPMTPNVEVTGSPASSASPRGLPGYASGDEK